MNRSIGIGSLLTPHTMLRLPSFVRPLLVRLPRSRDLRRVFLLLCAGLTLATALTAAPVKIDLPEQALPASLMAVARQADVQVLFPHNELKDLKAPALAGEFEPADALARLLEGSGFVVVPQGAKQFLVRKATAGSLRGALLWPEGSPAPGVEVAMRGTSLSTVTNAEGVYFFPEVPAGTYLLIAQAEGYQPLHLSSVTVKAGEDVVLARQTMRKGTDLTKLEPFVVTAESVTRLGDYEVVDRKAKVFSTGNLDVPRTINDVQAYQIFDGRTLLESGAVNTEDFLKQRLSMNTNVQSIGQGYGSTYGQTSSINLRGLGLDATLILVNGRERAGVSRQLNSGQADINGIPLEAIERIEVLPSSASAIYGANAIGGVVNIILKSGYEGGSVTASYENTTSSDAPIWSTGINYGTRVEGGRTRLALTARYSDGQALYGADRRELIERGVRNILQNQPSNIYSITSPFVGGATPNIALNPNSYAPPGGVAYTNPSTASLLLKDGTSLNSRITHVPSGAAPGANLGTQLVANAGSYNTDLGPNITRYGLNNMIGWTPPRLRSFMGSVSREMTPWLEAYVDFSYEGNQSSTIWSPLGNYRMAGDNPNNPFQQNIYITLPVTMSSPTVNDTVTRTLNAGLRFDLPAGWRAVLDYTWSRNAYTLTYFDLDTQGIERALADGTLNPFVDTALHPLDLEPYRAPTAQDFSTTIRDFSLRGSGPLPTLLGVTPRLVAGFQYKESILGEGRASTDYPVSNSSDYSAVFFSQQATASAAFAEISVPVIPAGKGRPGLRELEFQAAARADYYVADIGMSSMWTFPGWVAYYPGGGSTPSTTRTESKFDSLNPTFGVKYKPTESITLRASSARAFLPPSYSDVVPTPQPYIFPVYDPVLNDVYDAEFILGGNPNLKPKTSRSLTIGAIYEPVDVPALRGLRVNLEYYEINQFGVITAPTDMELLTYPEFASRVIRDPVTGRITHMDASLINGYEYRTEGFDLSVGYQRDTALGTFEFNATGTYILREQRQSVADGPFVEYAGYVNEGGPAKRKASATLSWRKAALNLGWVATYYDRYYQSGVVGGPGEQVNGFPSTYYTGAQGADTIPSQTYHDVFGSYTFANSGKGGRSSSATGMQKLKESLLSGLTVQFGIKNLFDTLPPFDAYRSPYFISPYGAYRLRTYWLSVKHDF